MSDNFCPACGSKIAAQAAVEPAAVAPVVTADQNLPAMLAAAEAQRERDALAAANLTSPEAGAGYTVEQLKALTARDFAEMDPTQFADVQRVLATLSPAPTGGRR